MLQALLLTLALFLKPSHADEIDDRIRRGDELYRQQAEARDHTWLVEANTERLRAFANYVADHGGLREDATCKVYVRRCTPTYRNPATRDPYRTFGDSDYCPYDRTQELPYSYLNAGGDYRVRSCRFNANDGRACEVEQDQERTEHGLRDLYQATCVDLEGKATLVPLNGDGHERRAPARPARRRR